MGRTTSYNKVFTEDLWETVDKKNKRLIEEFVDYKHSSNKSDTTIYQYESQLKLFFIWNLENNENKFFVDIKKKDFSRFFGYSVRNGKSPNRICGLKSLLSSFSTFIENMLDDDYPDFRNLVKSVDVGDKDVARKKTILSEEQVDYCLSKLVEMKKYQVACYFALAVASGARKSELVRFKTNYFTDDNIVYGCLYKTPEDIKTKGRGKKGKMLPKYSFVATLKPYLELWLKEREKMGITEEFLFVTYKDGKYLPATPTSINSWAKTISSILEINFYTHCVRHLWTTKLKKAGLPDDIIVALQGWSEKSGGQMVSLYDDSEKEDMFGHYFDENGIKEVKKTSLSDL